MFAEAFQQVVLLRARAQKLLRDGPEPVLQVFCRAKIALGQGLFFCQGLLGGQFAGHEIQDNGAQDGQEEERQGKAAEPGGAELLPGQGRLVL